MGVALVAGVRYETRSREIPDIYVLTVVSDGAVVRLPWNVSLSSSTSGSVNTDVTGGLYKDHIFNIPGGDLRKVLHQTLHEVDIPLFTNDQFEALGARQYPSLGATLRTYMSGLEAPPVVGRFTPAAAVARAISGTGCRLEWFHKAAVYIFCRTHLEFDITVNGEADKR